MNIYSGSGIVKLHKKFNCAEFYLNSDCPFVSSNHHRVQSALHIF